MNTRIKSQSVSLVAASLLLQPVMSIAHEPPTTEEVMVMGRALDLSGRTFSASEGYIGATDLAKRPLLRAGELLEVVPGTAVTQHSGTGKANQYFLRGFNLDHGTDFAAFLDGVPLNQPTHGHGQGYLDLNPIIPELVSGIEFGKGPYHAEIGDFSSAGFAKYSLIDSFEQPVATVTAGEFDFYRAFSGNSVDLAAGTLLGAFEAQYYDGPWELDEDAHKVNAVLKFTPESAWLPRVTALYYDADWTSTDQVPQRAIDAGIISRLGNIDPTLGGEQRRGSLNLQLSPSDNLEANAYVTYSDFRLFSNFTYFLDDPVNGDQITQRDNRVIAGGQAAYLDDFEVAGLVPRYEVGVQARHDRIFDVALLQSQARQALDVRRRDDVRQTSVGIYGQLQVDFTDFIHGEVGARVDHFSFDVDSFRAANTGDESDTIFSPKASLVLGPWRNLEFFANAGQGFHSNDGRGTVQRVDTDGVTPVQPVDPLVSSFGAETGMRLSLPDKWNASIGLWYLNLDSELVFVGDAGTTEPSGESERYGIEVTSYYQATSWLTLETDLAFTESQFVDAVDDEVPQSVGRVIGAAAYIDLPNGIFGALRLRHFGDSPLEETGAVKADSTTVVNLRAGYRVSEQMDLKLDVFNLFDSQDPDISYFFASCLPSDGPACSANGGVEDVHLHPVEPRAIRGTVSYRF